MGRQSVKIENQEFKFKFRVSGILKVNNKVLIVRMDDAKFYCLPGGYVELGEDTEEAVLREMEEEIGYKVKITKFIGIIENFFTSKKNVRMHEIGMYYLVEPVNVKDANLEDYTLIENDKGRSIKLEFKWVEIPNLNDINFEPKLLKSTLRKSEKSFIHFINKDDKN